MSLLQFYEQLIPEYPILSENEPSIFQAVFQRTKEGQMILEEIAKHMNEIDAFSKKSTSWSGMFYDFAYSFVVPSYSMVTIKDRAQRTTELIAMLRGHPDYLSLSSHIAFELVCQKHPDLSQLSKINQQLLMGTEGYKHLQTQLLPLEQSCRQLGQASELNSQKTQLIANWKNQFLTESDANNTTSIKLEIEQLMRKAWEENATNLVRFFPFLNQDKQPENASVRQLVNVYQLQISTDKATLREVDKKRLMNSLHNYLHGASQKHLTFINLDHFNRMRVTPITELLLAAFDSNKAVDHQKWTEEYKKDLLHYTKEQCLLSHNEKWQIGVNESQKMTDSLSTMFWNIGKVKETTEFLNKLSEAHAFMQATCFASQNENYLSTFLDLYNTKNAADQINETKSILLSLLEPFRPLYDEYKDIAFYEKNTYSKLFRAVMPLIVLVGFVVIVAFALTPLALPEVAFILILIPTVIVGAFLAAQYTSAKNSLYHFLRQSYYGGVFEIPEFQINQRMSDPNAFGTKEKATSIRNVYVEELEKCDKLERTYLHLESIGVLSHNGQKDREKNSKRRHGLWLEWYDIHSNTKLGCDEISAIAKNRLGWEVGDEVKQMESKLENEDLAPIQSAIEHVGLEIKQHLIRHSAPSDTMPDQDVPPNNRYSPGLFKPGCLENKARAEQLVSIMNGICV